MNKPDLQLQSLLNDKFEAWKKEKRGYCVNALNHAVDDVFKAGWLARDEVKRFHHEAEVESLKEEIERLEALLLDLGEEKDDAQSEAFALKHQLKGVEKAIGDKL